MTEAEWLACNDSEEIHRFLSDRAADRKLWLFAAACFRNLIHLSYGSLVFGGVFGNPRVIF